MKKLSHVVMLSTNKKEGLKNIIVKYAGGNLSFFGGDFKPNPNPKSLFIIRGNYTTNYLYFGVKAKIEKGDWYLVKCLNEDDFTIKYFVNQAIYDSDIDACNSPGVDVLRVDVSTDPDLHLARPSKEFLERYCREGGWEKVLIDYCENEYGEFCVVASDNTVTISPVRKEYKDTEVSKLLMKVLYDAGKNGYSEMNLREKSTFLSDWMDFNLHNL